MWLNLQAIQRPRSTSSHINDSSHFIDPPTGDGALADISEDELNEFIELQEEAPKKRRRQKTRESFVCFISFYESIKLMPERLHLRAFRVLMDYAFYQKEPPTKTPTRIMQSFVSWRKQVDVNSQKYDRKVESNWGGKDGDEKADNDGT